jgi:hypothetical protein
MKMGLILERERERERERESKNRAKSVNSGMYCFFADIQSWKKPYHAGGEMSRARPGLNARINA